MTTRSMLKLYTVTNSAEKNVQGSIHVRSTTVPARYARQLREAVRVRRHHVSRDMLTVERNGAPVAWRIENGVLRVHKWPFSHMMLL